MSVLRERPYAGMNFLVDLGTGNTDGAEAGLAEVVFPEARIHSYDYRNGNERENAVRMVEGTRDAVVMTWIFRRARPVNHQFSALNANGADPLMETLEIAFERLDME